MQAEFGGGDEIRFERVGRAGVVTLTRPQALNAVTHKMVLALQHALDAWRDDDGVALVVIKAEGRAFSAGGDILHIYEAGKRGEPPYDFFADEYRLNAAIARFPKPYVALIDGIAMGGGVGVSFHGSHRVVTEKAVFAMPETGIGFFPDVGGSRLLSGLPGEFGLYLALTTTRIRWGDMIATGLATDAVASDDLDGLLAALASSGDAGTAIAAVSRPVEPETGRETLDRIAALFAQDSLDAVMERLDAAAENGDDFAADARAAILKKSPTSLRVAFRQIREGRGLSMDDCMRMEFRILHRMLVGHDFYEGIRAAIIEKGSAPHWEPARLRDIDSTAIDAYFATLAEEELVL